MEMKKIKPNQITPNPDSVLDSIERRLQQLESRQLAQQALIGKPKFAIGDRVVSNGDAEGNYVGTVVALEGDGLDRVIVSFGDEPPRTFPVRGLERPESRLGTRLSR